MASCHLSVSPDIKCIKDSNMLPLLPMPCLDTLAHIDSAGADTVDSGICSMGPIKVLQTLRREEWPGSVTMGLDQTQQNGEGPQVLCGDSGLCQLK